MLNFTQPPAPKSVFTRAAQAFNYVIRGRVPAGMQTTISSITGETWMSPLQPLPPFQPIVGARQFDYPVGRNLFYQPRGNERYTFEQLRNVARYSELVRLAIETRLDQISALKWQIKPLLEQKDAVEDSDPRIDELTDFFSAPDKVHDWDQWLRLVLEELFVTDAVSLNKRRNKGGGLFALEPVDGATIFPLIDADGRTPLPPNPAYQQILKGQPKADYSMDELIYYVRKSQVNTPYGWSAVEQVISSAETDIERIKYTLSYFTEGSMPDAYVTSPDGMTAEKVVAYQEAFNGILAGNRAGRRQMPFLVHGMEVKPLKQPDLKNEFDEWLARKICFAFSLPPTAFVRQLNRSTAENDQQRAKDEGLYPVTLYVKRLMDRVIHQDFGYKDLEFHWNDDEERDPKTQAEIHQIYVNAGIMSRDEVRDELGLDDVPGGEEPLVTTASGPMPLPGSALDQANKEEQADLLSQQQQHAVTLAQTTPPKDGSSGNDNNPTEKMVKKKLLRDGYSSRSTHLPTRGRKHG